MQHTRTSQFCPTLQTQVLYMQPESCNARTEWHSHIYIVRNAATIGRTVVFACKAMHALIHMELRQLHVQACRKWSHVHAFVKGWHVKSAKDEGAGQGLITGKAGLQASALRVLCWRLLVVDSLHRAAHA